ncbi:hypothetical protein V7128_17675 [Neobacillus vireti]
MKIVIDRAFGMDVHKDNIILRIMTPEKLANFAQCTMKKIQDELYGGR